MTEGRREDESEGKRMREKEKECMGEKVRESGLKREVKAFDCKTAEAKTGLQGTQSDTHTNLIAQSTN